MNKRVLALLALVLSACSPRAEAQPAKPALWAVSDRDTTIYLFGSIHLLPEKLDWITPRISRAMADSHGLYLEVVVDRDPASTAALMSRIAVTPGLPPLLERVPADKRAQLQALAAKTGVPLALLDRYETWAAALTLATASLRDMELSQRYGVEEVLRKSFSDAGKPVLGLETTEQQLGYFDGLPEEAQRQFLAGVLDDQAAAKQEFDRMIAAWRGGNTRAIAASFNDEMEASDALAEALLTRRNARWAEQLAARMATPGTVFVAVGAGHLAGEDSVEDLLAAKGFRVRRVQ